MAPESAPVGKTRPVDDGMSGEDAATRFVLKWPMHAPVEVFSMPDDAVVIDVRTQHGVPTLWTLSSTDSVDVPRTFVGYGTGHPISLANEVYVGSAHDVEGGGLVFHIFERLSHIGRDADAPNGRTTDD